MQRLKSSSVSFRLNLSGIRVINSQLGLGLVRREKPRLATNQFNIRGDPQITSTQLGLDLFSGGKLRLAVGMGINLCGTCTTNIRLDIDLVPNEKTGLTSMMLNRSDACIVNIRLSLDLVSTKKPRLHSIRLNHRGTRVLNIRFGFDLASREKPRLANSRFNHRGSGTINIRHRFDVVFRVRPGLSITCLDLRGARTISIRLVCVLVSRERTGLGLHVILTGRRSQDDLLLHPNREGSEILVKRTVANVDAVPVRLVPFPGREPGDEGFLHLLDLCVGLF